VETDIPHNMNAQKLMGIDYGSKRIGLAFSDEGCQFALPHSVIKSGPEAVEHIVKIAADAGIQEVVMGESKNYKGEANAILAESLEFKKALESRGFAVHLEPEFMTSAHVEKLQGRTDMTDASAAALILQSFLDKRRNQVA
jgi:putative holliday junction resolvase